MKKLTILLPDPLHKKLPTGRAERSNLIRKLLAEWAGDPKLADTKPVGRPLQTAQ